MPCHAKALHNSFAFHMAPQTNNMRLLKTLCHIAVGHISVHEAKHIFVDCHHRAYCADHMIASQGSSQCGPPLHCHLKNPVSNIALLLEDPHSVAAFHSSTEGDLHMVSAFTARDLL